MNDVAWDEAVARRAEIEGIDTEAQKSAVKDIDVSTIVSQCKCTDPDVIVLNSGALNHDDGQPVRDYAAGNTAIDMAKTSDRVGIISNSHVGKFFSSSKFAQALDDIFGRASGEDARVFMGTSLPREATDSGIWDLASERLIWESRGT